MLHQHNYYIDVRPPVHDETMSHKFSKMKPLRHLLQCSLACIECSFALEQLCVSWDLNKAALGCLEKGISEAGAYGYCAL